MFYEAEQVSLFDQDTWSGKMSPEPSAPTEDKISQRSSKRSSKSASRMPIFKCVSRISDGQNPGAITLKMEDGALLGEYTMRSFGEYPREENASLLSQILEDSPHPKYSLSAKACMGILNRAQRRGKELPPELKAALIEQSVSKNEPENLGGGKGILIQPERTGALSTLNNQSVFQCKNTEPVPNPVIAIDQQAVLINNPTVGALCARDYKGVGNQYVNEGKCISQNSIVRRLIPLECERLQGFPDGWTDIGDWVDSKGKKHKAADSPRYKALGNSIALPYWKVLLKRISAQYDRNATMASLFDGIGGFPYLWEQINGKGSCLWASEIEEFPMAVTKVRFNDAY